MSGLSVKNFKVQVSEHQICADDFEVRAGEFLTVEAPSGFGKTTLLRGLMGFQPLVSGEISLQGKRIETLPAHERDLGVVFQDGLLFSHLTALENALFGLKIRGRVDDGAKLRAKAAFEALGIAARLEAPVQELSGGEKQRVALIRALIFEPKALILDEPLKGLDAASLDRVLQYLKEQVSARPIPVIWVSHQGPGTIPGGRIIGTEDHGHRRFTYYRQ